MNTTQNLKIAYHPLYAHPLPEGHRFPMLKYELIPGQLLHEGSITNENIFTPAFCAEAVVLLTHDEPYLQKLFTQQLSSREQRVIGFPQSAQLTQRERMIAQGTIDCMQFALHAGVALNVAGGTHHAFADRGEGFCMLNDQAIAANYFLQQNPKLKIVIIDLDVHQGNGTAKLMENNKSVFTFSMHGQNNYPFRKEKSDLDVGLPDGTDDEGYLALLKLHLCEVLDQVKPDMAFYLSGVDVLATDRYGKLKLTLAGCKQRDVFVFDELYKRKIPCAVSMGGGYSADVRIITEAHCNTFRAAKDIWQLG